VVDRKFNSAYIHLGSIEGVWYNGSKKEHKDLVHLLCSEYWLVENLWSILLLTWNVFYFFQK